MVNKSRYEIPQVVNSKQISGQVYCTDCRLFTGIYQIDHGNLFGVTLKTNCCNKTINGRKLKMT